MDGPVPTPVPSSLESRRERLSPQASGSCKPPLSLHLLCSRLRSKACSIPFEDSSLPGEKGWFPETVVGQTGGEGKERKKGWGRGTSPMVSASHSWALPCALAPGGQPGHSVCCPTGSPGGCPRARSFPAHVLGIAACHQLCGKCSPLPRALSGSCFPHHT